MFDKLQLSVWEWFVYFLSGFLVVLSISGSYIAFSDVKNVYEILKITGENILVFLVLLVLIGKLLEPLANFVEELIFRPLSKKYKPVAILLGDARINKWMDSVREEYLALVKEKVQYNFKSEEFVYRWAKDYLMLKGLNLEILVYLSRFGFYRNVWFILLVTSLYWIVVKEFVWGIILLIVSFIYRYRSKKFHIHLNQAVYNQFLISNEGEG